MPQGERKKREVGDTGRREQNFLKQGRVLVGFSVAVIKTWTKSDFGEGEEFIYLVEYKDAIIKGSQRQEQGMSLEGGTEADDGRTLLTVSGSSTVSPLTAQALGK